MSSKTVTTWYYNEHCHVIISQALFTANRFTDTDQDLHCPQSAPQNETETKQFWNCFETVLFQFGGSWFRVDNDAGW